MLKKMKFRMLDWLLTDDAIAAYVTRKVIRGREVKQYIVTDSSNFSITDSILVDSRFQNNHDVTLSANTALGFIFTGNSARSMTANRLVSEKER